MNENWVKTFVKLVELGHFTKASEALNMTQPGVSQHLEKLETQLGVSLINRYAKGFELTNDGEKLYSFACKRIIEESEFLEAIGKDIESEGSCRFACSGSMSNLLYSKFLERQVSFSSLSIHMEAAPNYLIREKILNNEIDIGIVTEKLDSKELKYISLGYESLCLVLPHKYKNKKITYATLLALGFIDHPDGKHYCDRLLGANFEDYSYQLASIYQSGYINQINQILEPVVKGLGFTVLPLTVVQNSKESDLICIADLDNIVRDELFLLYKKYRPIAKRYDWFIQKIKNILSS